MRRRLVRVGRAVGAGGGDPREPTEHPGEERLDGVVLGREQHPDNARNLVRACGYGVPRLERALWSARHALTLVVQEAIQPFDREGGRPAMRDMHLHSLPWPEDALRDLGEEDVELRVTLSYFVESSPGQRGWRYRHRYPSHGLRFDVKSPRETVDQFRWRVNEMAREEEDGRKPDRPDGRAWVLGPDLRGLGSVHSDRWRGAAAQLADCGYLAVYPVIGWWRERPDLGHVDRSARYALAVSIRTPTVATDIYTPVANKVAIPAAGRG